MKKGSISVAEVPWNRSPIWH